MQAKESKIKQNFELMRTIELIQNFWPDCPYPLDSKVFGNVNFIVEFFSNFLAELNDKTQFLLNEDVVDEVNFLPDFDKRVGLCVRTNRILRKLGSNALNLIDFYVPNPKKMFHLVTLAAHFVTYINNNMETLSEPINGSLKKQEESENLKVLKQQLLQETAKNAEAIGRGMEEKIRLVKERKQSMKEHEELLEAKAQQEKDITQLTVEIKALQNDIQHLEVQLQLQEDTEKDLKECLVTDEEYAQLRQTEKSLEQTLQQLSHDATGDEVDQVAKDNRILEKCAQKISEIRLDNLGTTVRDLHDAKQEMQLKIRTLQDLTKRLNDLTATATEQQQNIDRLQETFTKQLFDLEKLKQKFTEIEGQEAKELAAELKNSAANFEQKQNVETEILREEEEIAKIDDDVKKMYEMVTEEYQMILNKNKEVTNKFHDALTYMNSECGGLMRGSNNN